MPGDAHDRHAKARPLASLGRLGQRVRGAVLIVALTTGIASPAPAQDTVTTIFGTGITDYDSFLGWVQRTVPRHLDPGLPDRAMPSRAEPVRTLTQFPAQTAEANRSVLILTSELIGALAHVTGVGFRSRAEFRNLVVLVGTGLTEDGKLTEAFFARHKLDRSLEDALRRTSGWSRCHTHVLLSDADTVAMSISIMDDALAPADKRVCAYAMIVQAFSLSVAPEHIEDIESFFPRYIALAAARTRCGKHKEHADLTRCIAEQFETRK